MRDKNLSIIREACIKANPEIRTRRPEILVNPKVDLNVTEPVFEPPIRLADVVLAVRLIDVGSRWRVRSSVPWRLTGFNFDYDGGVVEEPLWNLRNDFLDAQSPECLEFLAQLLAVEKDV